MSKEDKLTAEETTSIIMNFLSVSDQFRITNYLKTVMRMMPPSPSTRWYDICNLRWPDDRQSWNMDRYITLDDIKRRLEEGESLREIISRDGRWIGRRWRLRILTVFTEMTCHKFIHKDWHSQEDL